jgi:hypothetical protein
VIAGGATAATIQYLRLVGEATGTGGVGGTAEAGQAAGAVGAGGGGTITAGGATATAQMSFEAGGLFTANGQLFSPFASTRSRDIEILPGAQIGTAGSRVSLSIIPSGQQAILGGSTNGGGYTLDAAEARRIQGVQLSLDAPRQSSDPNRPPDLLVRDLSLSAGQIGSLGIGSAGVVRVEGNLLLSNAISSANRIHITGETIVTKDSSTPPVTTVAPRVAANCASMRWICG